MDTIYLYIKHHSITGKLYFGKTTCVDPVKYLGSGKRWKSHIKAHGKEYVETLWYCLFTNKEECSKFALMCSELWNIVISDQWLNFIPEDGLSGGASMTGRHHSEETKAKISAKQKGRKLTPELYAKISAPKIGQKLSDDARSKISASKIGKKRSTEACAKISAGKTGKKRKPFSEETLRKMSEAHKGKKREPLSEETKAKISEALTITKGKNHD